MRKILLLVTIFLTCLSVKAQQITFTSTSPIYSNDASVLITAQGEDNNLAVDMGTLPSVTGVTPSVFPTNGAVYLTDIKRISYYSASQHTKSSFTAKVYTTVNFEVTASWEIKVSFVNINGPSISTGTVKYKVTVRPGSSPDPVVYNTEQFKFFDKQNCTEVGTIGSSVKYTVAAGKYTGASLTAANNKAINDINANGQNYANANGTCIPGYYSEIQSKVFTPSCGQDFEYQGENVTYTVPAKKYTGATLQEANAKALNDLNTNGQTYANNNKPGNCLQYYYNNEISAVYYKNDCGTGYSSTPITYTIPAKKYRSTTPFSSRPIISSTTTYPDNLLVNDFNANGQNFANATGTCILPLKVYARIAYYGKNSSRPVLSTTPIIITFYSDEAATMPISVYNRLISYTIKVDGVNVSSTGSISATGQSVQIGTISSIVPNFSTSSDISLTPSNEYQILPTPSGGRGTF